MPPAEAAEADLDASLDEVIARLEAPLDAQWIAEMLRERMGAEIGLATSAVVLDQSLPAGPLRRRDLWETCHSTANPAITQLTGAQLLQMVERGNNPVFVQTTTNALRGRPRGTLQVAAETEINPARTYSVAATDFEFERYGELIEPSWTLSVRYDFPTIIREAIEDRLAEERD